jgi:hypothetical protein
MAPVSSLSFNCPVKDEETLVRIVVSPRDADRQAPREPSEELILDVCFSGLSVLRHSAVPDVSSEIEKLARELVMRQASRITDAEEAVCMGVFEFSTLQVRAYRDADRRILGVYESPEEDYPSHADVLEAVNIFPSRNKAKLAARNFFQTIKASFIRADAYTRANIAGLSMRGQRQAS